jgi:hypothetical protein
VAVAWSSLLSGSRGEFLIIYEVNKEVEVFYHGMWLPAVVKDRIPVKTRNKHKKDFLYLVGSTESNHLIYNIRPCDIRLPMKYPTRKAVWSIQKHDEYGEWVVHRTSFRRDVWCHSLQKALELVKRHYDVYRANQEIFRLYNHQTGEEISLAGICD